MQLKCLKTPTDCEASITKKFYLIHIISGLFDISEGESDQSGETTESRKEKESEPEEATH